MTSWPSADQHRWPHESAYFQAILAMDHLDHLFTKRNRNKYTRKSYPKFFIGHPGPGGPRGPKASGTRPIST